MIPTTLLGVVLLIAGLAPGYVYVRTSERRAPRIDRSRLLEVAEVLGVGLMLTGLSSVVVSFVGRTAPTAFVDIRDWIAGGNSYLRDHPYEVTASVGLALAGSLLASWSLARLVHRGAAASLRPELSIWHQIFGPNPDTPKFVHARLRDGSVVEGFAFAYTFNRELVDREIALQKPMFMSESAAAERQPINADALILRGDDILQLAVTLWRPGMPRSGPAEVTI